MPISFHAQIENAATFCTVSRHYYSPANDLQVTDTACALYLVP